MAESAAMWAEKELGVDSRKAMFAGPLHAHHRTDHPQHLLQSCQTLAHLFQSVLQQSAHSVYTCKSQ